MQAIPVAERSKARVFCLSLVGIAGSIPAGSMDICSFIVVCCQVEVSGKGRSLLQRSSTASGVLLCVI